MAYTLVLPPVSDKTRPSRGTHNGHDPSARVAECHWLRPAATYLVVARLSQHAAPSGHWGGPQQEDVLEVWCAALWELLGPEDPDHGTGERIFIYWPNFMGCTVMLDGQRQAAEKEAG